MFELSCFATSFFLIAVGGEVPGVGDVFSVARPLVATEKTAQMPGTGFRVH